MQWIDTHAHWYDESYEEDREAALQRAIEAGVQHIYLPNCDRSTVVPMLRICNAHPKHCFPMMGLHPCYVKENFEEELAYMETTLSQTSFAAIGEIGLDYYWDKTFVAQQKEAFARQIIWANLLRLPIVIHSRAATADCIALVQEHKHDGLKGVFHCFSGSMEEAHQIVALGCYIGIGGVVTYKKSNLSEIVKGVGLQNIVLETDAPYLSPVPYRGKRNESAYIPIIGTHIAQVLQVPVSEIADVTTANALRLFS